jgi:PAS domain S-box-containing protein
MLLDERSPGGAGDSFDRLSAAMDLLPVGVMLVAGDSVSNARVVACNAACAELLGVAPAAATSPIEPPLACYRPDRSEPLPPSDSPWIRAVVAGEAVEEQALHVRRPDGGWRVLRASASPLAREGRAAGAVVVCQDVTERYAAQRALQESGERYARLAATVPGVLYEYERGSDGDGRFTYLSPRSQDLFEIDGQAIANDIGVLRRMARPRDARAIQEGPRADEAHGGEVRIVTPSGGTKWIEFLSLPAPAPAGVLERRSGFILDITERRRTEEALREAEEWLKLTVEATGAGTLRAVPFGPATISPRFRQMFGGIEQDAIKNFESFLTLLYPDDRDRAREALLRSLDPSGDGLYDIEYRCVWPDGSLRWIAARGKAQFAEVEGTRRAIRFAAVALDITGRKRREEALRASEARYARLAATVPGVIYEFTHFTEGGRFTYLSPRCAEVLEVEAQAILDDMGVFWTMVLLEDARALQEAMEAAGRSGLGLRAEARIVTPSGRQKWIEFTSLRSPTALGEVAVCSGFMLDVTERKRAEEAVRASEARCARLAATAPGVLYEFELHPDGTGRFSYVSPRCSDIFELESEELLSDMRLHRKMFDPGDFRAFERVSLAATRARVPFSAEARITTPSGQRKWLQFTSLPCPSEPGGIERRSGFILDVTDRKREEDSLRESEERFHALADNIPQHAFMADARGEIFWVNRRVLEYSGETSMGRGYLQLIHPDHAGRLGERIERCLKTGETLEETFPLRGKDGRYRWFLCRAVALRDEAGQVVRWFGTNTDVTELRETEDLLREADRRKSQFLAVLSHELRNPLAPIRNSLYLLACAQPGSEQAGRAIEVIDRQARHLTHLVDDLLDATRIAHGKIELHPERVDLREVVRRVCDDHRSMFDQRGVGLRLEDPGPIWVEADATRMSQAVGNLLQNALKFTWRGGMTWVSLGVDDGRAVIRVRDDGAGMEPGQVQRMFEPFAQADTGLARPHGGLGLGLALVKGVVELHGGSVAATSEGLGCGSEFTIALPLCEPPHPYPARVKAAAGSGRLILVIEDNVDACETLAQVLRVGGHRVSVALDGRTGIEEARRLVPDVVLCDIGLPDVDGHAVARALRADASLSGTRLIALTGYAQPEDRALAREAGFDAHLPKPAPLDELERLIAGGGASG